MAFNPNDIVSEGGGLATDNLRGGFSFNSEDIVHSQNRSTEPTKEEDDKIAYVINEMKKGSTETVGLASAVATTGGVAIQDFLGLRPDIDLSGYGDVFMSALSDNTATLRDITGVDPTIPEADTKLGKFAEGGIRAVADPISLLFAPLKAGTTAAKTGINVLANRAAEFGIGTLAAAGADLGGNIEEAFTDDGSQTGIGATAGALLLGSSGIPTRAGVRLSAKALTNKWGNAKNKAKEVEDNFVSTAGKNLLEAISREEGLRNIDDIVSNFNKLSDVVGVDDFPLMVAMSKNPAVRDQMRELAKLNPDFRATVTKELDLLSQKINQNGNRIFGVPEGEEFAPLSIDGVMGSAKTKKSDVLLEQIAKIDDELDGLQVKFNAVSDKQIVGKQAAKIMEKKKKAVVDLLSPQYNALREEASNLGITITPDATRNIWEHVQQAGKDNLFQRIPAINKLITNNFAPKTEVTKFKQDLFSNKKVPVDSKEVFPAVSYGDMDSLKRELNAISRKNLSDADRGALEMLKDVVGDSRKTMSGGFNEKLKAVDKLYYENLGLPFNAEGAKRISSAKYADEVSAVLTRNKSSMGDFLAITGDEGIPIARDAILSEMYQKVVKDGRVNAPALRAYLKNKEGVIGQVPNLRKELDGVVDVGETLKVTREKLDNRFKLNQKQIANNLIGKLEGELPNYSVMAKQLLSDPQYRHKLFKDLDDLKSGDKAAVITNLKRNILTEARKQPDAMAFLTDINNKEVIEKAFGKGYAKDLHSLATLSDAVKNADVSNVQGAVQIAKVDPLQAKYGVSATYVASQARDRIASTTQKALRIISKSFTAGLGDKTDDALAELLLSPDGLKKLSKIANRLNKQKAFLSAKDLKEVSDIITDTIPSIVYNSVRAGARDATQEEQQ